MRLEIIFRTGLKYIYYLLKCLGNIKTSDKSAVPGVNRNDLHEMAIPYIEGKKQEKIAAVLSALDTKIQVNNRINAELESLAKTIYDYWFVQFDFPNEDGKPYKASGGEMVYHPELTANWNRSCHVCKPQKPCLDLIW